MKLAIVTSGSHDCKWYANYITSVHRNSKKKRQSTKRVINSVYRERLRWSFLEELSSVFQNQWSRTAVRYFRSHNRSVIGDVENQKWPGSTPSVSGWLPCMCLSDPRIVNTFRLKKVPRDHKSQHKNFLLSREIGMGFDYVDHYSWNSVVKEQKFNTEVCPFISVSCVTHLVEIILTAPSLFITDRYDTYFLFQMFKLHPSFIFCLIPCLEKDTQVSLQLKLKYLSNSPLTLKRVSVTKLGWGA